MNSKKILLITVTTIVVLFINASIRAVLTTSTVTLHKDPVTLKVDSVKAAINIHKSIYDKNKYIVGFHYEMLEKSMTGKELSIDIVPTLSKVDYWGKLIAGELDLIVTDDVNSIPEELREITHFSIPLGDCGIWVVREESRDLLEYINNWISYYCNSPAFEELQNRYFKKSHFSPYEFIIKENSRKFGWDWRLLAAIIHQESRFTPHAVSYVGATGLMQIMPATAKYYGAEDILNPNTNIEIGIRHLNRLRKQFLAEGMNQEEALKFTLAAYNAGEGKISTCRELASESGYDTSKWEEVSKVIAEVMTSKQTLNYVDSVLNKYEEYKLIAKR